MTNHDVVKKLIGNIEPLGESHIDSDRMKNLIETARLINQLVNDVKEVRECIERKEFSMNKAGRYADNFLAELIKEIKE